MHYTPRLRHLSCNDGLPLPTSLYKSAHFLRSNYNHKKSMPSTTTLQLLQTRILKNAVLQGNEVHSFMTSRGFESKLIINMYVKCGSLMDARKVFNHMKDRDKVSWNMIIAAYQRHGFPHESLRLFHQMQRTGFQPDQFTFASILPACAKIGALEHGMHIHQSIKEAGFSSDVVVASALVDMYAKCGSMDKARELFDKMPQTNMVSWTAMIVGYSQNGFVEKALETFKKMQLADVKPDSSTFSSILRACAQIGALEQGMDIHQCIIECGFLSNVSVASALVDMYVKCGSIDKAREVFHGMPERDVVSWTAMIVGYAQNGFLQKALETFKQMQLAGVKPDSTTFASILPAFGKMGTLNQCMEFHQSITEGGFLSDIVVVSAMVDMFAKCGSTEKASAMFNKMPRRNVVSWNAMIAGYAHNGFVDKALEIFKQMQLTGAKPDSTTFATILPACAKMGGLEQGMDIHRSITEGGYFADVVVASALVDMYAKCGNINKAYKLFDKMPQKNVVSWNVMIAANAQSGYVEKALRFFKQMQLATAKSDSSTFASILRACAQIGALEQGMDIHQSIIENGLSSDVVVASALVDMYAKCGRIDKARELFDRLPQRDMVSWTAMIVGYIQNGLVEKALKTFTQMQLAGVKPDSTTFASILPACAIMGVLEQGINIHQNIIENGNMSDAGVLNALVDMYAKCGSIDKARQIFDKMPHRNVVSWNAMVAGYAQNGFCDNALRIFELMKHSGTYPDVVSFTCVLYACSHAGLVNEGCTYFNHMSNHYYITPMVDHYICMVDLLGRAGYLEDTLNFIIKMPVKPLVAVWMCFLGSCRLHMNIGLGVFTATLIFYLDPESVATYVLLSNIYAEVGRWGEAQMIRRLMKDRRIKKIPGCSWIEGHKTVHAFCV